MRSSTIVGSLFVALVGASPVHQILHKKAIAYDVITDIVTVTVTAGQIPESTEEPDSVIKVQKTVFAAPTPTPAPAPAPEPTPEPVVQAPAPEPTTETPAPAPTVVEQPPVYIETSAAAVIPSSVPVVEAPTSSTGSGFKDACLNTHNSARAKHQAGSLSWDDGAASGAQDLANKCSFAHGGEGYGQNIYMASSGDDESSAITTAINYWYDEEKLYSGYYNQDDVSDKDVLHFTQVVWKNTTMVGCAVKDCTASGWKWFAVCNYAAPGNFGGQFASNVLPSV